MLKPGIYHAEKADTMFDAYSIRMEVKETDKSYIFTLLDLDTRYGATQIEDLFRNNKRMVIQKNRPGHAIRVWDDSSFTFYPYQAGVPYYFLRIEEPGRHGKTIAHTPAASKQFTKAQIMDILQGMIKQEDENCKHFYELNPTADDERHRCRSVYNAALTAAMHQFN